MVPGFVDIHEHITGGGGEAGPASRTVRLYNEWTSYVPVEFTFGLYMLLQHELEKSYELGNNNTSMAVRSDLEEPLDCMDRLNDYPGLHENMRRQSDAH